MDLTGNRNMKSSNEEKIKKTLKTTIVILSVISILIIILIGLLYVQKKKALKIFIDGADNTKIMDSKIVFEGDKIYITIKTFAKQVGYEVFDGEYKQSYIEDKNKCYIKNKDEVRSYVLDSNQIYKKIITTNEVSNYEYFEIDEPVKKINGELYASINGISNGCNVAISYNKENNKIDIYTLSKLVTSYTAQGTKFEKTSALVGEDVNYSNQKAILYGMMVVKNDEKKFGVCDLKGQTIMSQIIGFKTSDTIYDTQTASELKIEGEPIYFDNSPDSLAIMRHTCAHLMAEAIKSLYPEAQFFVGPVVEEGFYYDFRVNHKIGEEDLAKIESKMKEIAKKGEQITKYHLPRQEAIEKFKGDDLKQAVISRIPQGDGTLSIYSQGDFEDLCRGPHLPTLKLLNAFKLTKIAGAYLGGDEKAEMLVRIYGIAFADKESLNQYLRQMEEAKKRDHRKVGTEMELFTFDEEIGKHIARTRLINKYNRVVAGINRILLKLVESDMRFLRTRQVRS